MAKINRRRFLRNAATMAGSAGLLSNLAMNQALAAETQGYKALVCLFFFGGMDNNDTILPVDASSYESFRRRREELMGIYGAGSGTSSRDRANILKLNPINAQSLGGREYGLPAELEQLKDLFDSRELAILGSVGPLIEPVTRAQFTAGSAALPKRLFSHNDQQSTWLALNVEGARRGWGGRLLDASLRTDAALDPTYMAITTRASSVFLTGDVASGFSVASSGPVRLRPADSRYVLGNDSHYNAARDRLRAQLERTSMEAKNLFEQDDTRMRSRGIRDGSRFTSEFENRAALSTAFPDNSLGAQLQTVAETISIRDGLGAKRQVFFVGLGGFDTHDGQAQRIPGLHSATAPAIKAFRDAMVELNVWNDVTLFTAADFGRTLNDNGDGTDHGWAGHHFIAGGSVRGGRVFGNLPDSDTTSNDYADDRGRLIPTTSVEQYAATLGSWFGLDQTELNRALPNLANFDSREIGFMV